MPYSEKHDEKDRAEAKLERLLLESLPIAQWISLSKRRILGETTSADHCEGSAPQEITPTWRKKERP